MSTKLKKNAAQSRTKDLSPQKEAEIEKPSPPASEIKPEPAPSPPAAKPESTNESPVVTFVVLIAVAWFMVCTGIILAAGA